MDASRDRRCEPVLFVEKRAIPQVFDSFERGPSAAGAESGLAEFAESEDKIG